MTEEGIRKIWESQYKKAPDNLPIREIAIRAMRESINKAIDEVLSEHQNHLNGIVDFEFLKIAERLKV